MIRLLKNTSHLYEQPKSKQNEQQESLGFGSVFTLVLVHIPILLWVRGATTMGQAMSRNQAIGVESMLHRH